MRVRAKTSVLIQKAVFVMLAMMMSSILILDLFFQNLEYFGRRVFLLPNCVLLLLGLMIFAAFAKLFLGKKSKVVLQINNQYQSNYQASILLFVLLFYISLNIYFSTDWDAGYVLNNARNVVDGSGIDDTYFSMYPNQQLLLFVESILIRINRNFGVIDSPDGLLCIIGVQCMLVAITGNVLYKILLDYSNSAPLSWFGWGLFCFLVALSGWITIPYTDELALIFPTLILRCYQLKEKYKKQPLFWWLLIALLSYWGYKMKPTVIILLVAIVGTEIVYELSEMSIELFFRGVKTAVSIILCFLLSSWLFTAAINSTGIRINREMDVGILHMIMMGLNDEHDGIWNADDVELSFRIKIKDERKRAQIDRIKNRLEDYGFAGMIVHTVKKTLVNFNDGSFAWGAEGRFYDEVFDNKNSFVSPLLKGIFYNDGEYYQLTSSIEQLLWITVIFFCCFCVFLEKNKMLTAAALSLIGIVLFVSMFEARARYVLIYVPIFIVLAMLNLNELYYRIRVWAEQYSPDTVSNRAG